MLWLPFILEVWFSLLPSKGRWVQKTKIDGEALRKGQTYGVNGLQPDHSYYHTLLVPTYAFFILRNLYMHLRFHQGDKKKKKGWL